MRFYLSLIFLFGIHISMASSSYTDTDDSVQHHMLLAEQYIADGETDLAILEYKNAKQLLMQYEDDISLVYVLNQLASLHKSDSSSRVMAQSYLDTANTILDNKLSGNDSLRALTWFTSAELKTSQEQYNTACAYYQKALALRILVYGEFNLKVAEVLERIGSIYLHDLENPYAARSFIEKELLIRDALDDNSRYRVNCFYNLASIARRQGDYDKALSYAYKVLIGYQNLEASDAYDLIVANNLLANINYDMDNIDQALEYNRNAINTAALAQFSSVNLLATLISNQSRYYFFQENYDSTIFYAQKALSYHPDQDIAAFCYQHLANAHSKKGEINTSFQYFQKSRTIKEKLFDAQHTQLATLYVDIGSTYAKANEIDSALYYYQKGLASARIGQDTADHYLDIQLGDDLETFQEAIHGVIDLLFYQYHLTQDYKYLNEILPYFQLFDRFMELSRFHFTSEESKYILSGNYKKTYEKAITACYYLYQLHPADSLLDSIFHYMEKSKAMVLLESVRKGEKFERALPDSLIDKKKSIQSQLAYLESQIIEFEEQESEVLNITDLHVQKADLLREEDVLNRYIENSYPNFFRVTHHAITVNIDSVQSNISDKQALISYYWGDTTAYALMITPDTVQLSQIKDLSSVNSNLLIYQRVLIDDDINAPLFSNFVEYQESTLELYQVLLQPLIDVKEIDHLILVLDGKLTNISFESLTTDQIENQEGLVSYERLPYLLKRYEISYEYSANIAFGTQQSIETSNDEPLNVTAFGIKDFERLQGNYAFLGGAEREVLYAQKKFPEANIFLNEFATERSFKQYAPQADILHIATHGVANQENPFASHFVFYPEGEEDGKLNLYELYNLPLQAKILLLTACESGVGKYFVGEGDISLARSFVYAGCKSVLMSLWQVNDFQTQQLVFNIYDYFHKATTVSKAVRNAKLDLIKGGTYAHPQCWAGIVPLGNSNIALSNNDQGIYYAAGLISLSVLILLIYFQKKKRYFY